MRSHLHKRQEARDELISTIRRYGVYLMAALVLLPFPLVGILSLCGGIVYYLKRRSI